MNGTGYTRDMNQLVAARGVVGHDQWLGVRVAPGVQGFRVTGDSTTQAKPRPKDRVTKLTYS